MYWSPCPPLPCGLRRSSSAGGLLPSNRIAPVAANAMASLNALAPGRIIAGLGTGYTARRTMGPKALKLADLKEFARAMRVLWSGDIIEIELRK